MPNVVERSSNLPAKVRDLEQRLLALERREQPTGSYLTGVDVYPDGEPSWGLWQRGVNRAGIEQYTNHHRAGTAPTGFSWAEGSGFNGEADTQWDQLGSFMVWEAGAPPHFLYADVATYINRRFYARLRVGSASEFGVRLDDGGTANYAEIVLDPSNTGTYVVDFRHKKAGGAETEVTGPTVVSTMFSVVLLRYDDDTVYGRLLAEDGAEVPIQGFDSGTVSWTPARVGLVSRGGGGIGDAAAVVSDWFWNSFE